MPDKGVGANMMELYIETLTGTAFELRVHPAETVQDVKARIQKMEGIPIAQQHLIWESTELEDDYCLCDYNIQDRSTLKLVLTLRGGPINTRRISMEDSSFADLADYGSEDGTDSLDATGQPFTVIVYHDGGHMKFFRVVDRDVLSPVLDFTRGTSSISRANKDDDEEAEGSSAEDNAMRQKMRTLRLKMEKVHLDRKLKKMPRPPSHGRPSSKRFGRHIVAKKPTSVLSSVPAVVEAGAPSLTVAAANNNNVTAQEKSTVSSEVAKADSGSTMADSTKEPPSTSAPEALLTSSAVNPAAVAAATEDKIVCNDVLNVTIGNSIVCPVDQEKRSLETAMPVGSLTDPIKRLSATTGRKLEFSPTVLLRCDETSMGRSSAPAGAALSRKPATTKKLLTLAMPVPPQTAHPPSTAAGSRPLERVPEHDAETLSGPGRPPQLDNTRSVSFHRRSPLTGAGRRSGVVVESIDPSEVHGVIKSIVRSAGTSKFSLLGSARRSRTEPSADDVTSSLMSSMPNPTVPAVSEPAAEAAADLPPVKLKRKVVTKCFTCAKRTGLATSYICRCGNNFCATHRYAEAHDCSFDYKSEGRKLLERSNPVVTAPKLPKI